MIGVQRGEGGAGRQTLYHSLYHCTLLARSRCRSQAGPWGHPPRWPWPREQQGGPTADRMAGQASSSTPLGRAAPSDLGGASWTRARAACPVSCKVRGFLKVLKSLSSFKKDFLHCGAVGDFWAAGCLPQGGGDLRVAREEKEVAAPTPSEWPGHHGPRADHEESPLACQP